MAVLRHGVGPSGLSISAIPACLASAARTDGAQLGVARAAAATVICML